MKLDDRFYESSRARAQQERMKKKKADDAIKQSKIIQRIEHERAEENAEQKLLFCLWYMLDTRYQNMLDTYGAQHSEVTKLKEVCEDLWFTYINIDRQEFYRYM